MDVWRNIFHIYIYRKIANITNMSSDFMSYNITLFANMIKTNRETDP